MHRFRDETGHCIGETMTAQEWIDKLSEYPADMPVIIADLNDQQFGVDQFDFKVDHVDKGYDACDSLIIRACNQIL